MLKSLWVKFLLLLFVVAAVGLSATFVLRHLMVMDFREYLEGEAEDRIYWLTASLESSYENKAGWDAGDMVENTVWAYMLGIDIRLLDAGGNLLMDRERALRGLSPLQRKRVMALSERWAEDGGARFVPYTLFWGGREIGRLEARTLRPKKEALFISRTNRFLVFSVFALGGVAVALGIVFSRKMTRPIKELTSAAVDISGGNLQSRVGGAGNDEIGRLSEAFNRMAEALSAQETLRRRLTANVAHELRTPLSAVRGELEGMMDGLIPADRESLQSLYAEIGRLRSILDGIEDLSQAEASSLSIAKRRVELCPFLKDIVERFRVVSGEKGVALRLSCAGGLCVNADPDKLSQVLVNLLSNALKATGAGGNVRVSAAAGGGGRVVIEVSDDGCGIRAEDLPFVFERFYRAAEGGLGIGLTIARELVEAHGGAIEVRSEYGKGSAFTVTLPA